MTPETKAWVSEEKKHYENYKFWAPETYETIYKSFQIIEDQAKEIERLNQVVDEGIIDIRNLHQKLQRFYANHHPDSVREIRGIANDGTCYALQIKNIITTNDGTFVEVILPRNI